MKLFVCNFYCTASKSRSGTALHACQRSAAATGEDSSDIASSAGVSQNCNNNCSRVSTERVCPLAVRPDASAVRARIAAINEMSSTPRGRRQPLPLVSPAAVAPRPTAPACQLPSPLVPYPCSQPATSVVCSAVSSPVSRPPATAKPLTAAPLSAVHPNQLPVYLTPECRPIAVPQPAGYAVPFCRPTGSHPGFDPRPGVCLHDGMFPSRANGSPQMLRPVGTFQPRSPLSYPQMNGRPPPQACISSAPSVIIPPAACHVVSTGRNDVPLKSTNFVGVPCDVQSQTVTDGSSPLASTDVCASLNAMGLDDVDLRLLQDAMKEECNVLGVGPNTSAGHVDSYGISSMSPRGVETSSAESDNSLSDWSIVELPSPRMQSSVGVDIAGYDQASVMKDIPVGSLASPPLMQFSSDSQCSDSSNLVSAGPMPGRVDQFPAQKLSPSGVPRPGSVVFLLALCALC